VDDPKQRGRSAYERRAWGDAYDAFSQAIALEVDDVERLAWSAGLSGHDDASLEVFERLHQLRLDAGEALRAARAAFWLALRLTALGEFARASGWLVRAQRLVDRDGRDCVERGYLRLPHVLRFTARRRSCGGSARAESPRSRSSDRDLSALGRSLADAR
jgi:hypothetical protein